MVWMSPRLIIRSCLLLETLQWMMCLPRNAPWQIVIKEFKLKEPRKSRSISDQDRIYLKEILMHK